MDLFLSRTVLRMYYRFFSLSFKDINTCVCADQNNGIADQNNGIASVFKCKKKHHRGNDTPVEQHHLFVGSVS